MLGKKLTCFLASAALALTLAATDFKITADAEMPVFRCGEKASFTVSATENGKPVSSGTCTVTFSLGGTGKQVGQGVILVGVGHVQQVIHPGVPVTNGQEHADGGNNRFG